MRNWLRRRELQLKNGRMFSMRRPARRVFYPGCSLPGADPEFCLEVYRRLQQQDPDLGLWFDCCAKPLRLAADGNAAGRVEGTLVRSLRAAGVEEVVTACGNCYQQFDAIAAEGLRVTLLYDLLEGIEGIAPPDEAGDWVIHHPCFARQNPALQDGALRLAKEAALRISNRDAKGHPLPCCLFRNAAAKKRRGLLYGKRLLTYCAHCVMAFQGDIPTRHLLQEIFGSKRTWTPPGKVGLFRNYRRFCRLVRISGGEGP